MRAQSLEQVFPAEDLAVMGARTAAWLLLLRCSR
jgi:hypothetical protein